MILRVPGAGVGRTYSVASTPAQPRCVELHVRRVPGGVASDGWISGTAAVGDQVGLSAPYGRFFHRPARTEPAILIAAPAPVPPARATLLRDA